MPKNLQDFVRQLSEEFPDLMLKVDKRVVPNTYDVTAILQRLDEEKRSPVVLFNSAENLLGEDSGVRIIANVFASRGLCATAMGMSPRDGNMPLIKEFAQRERKSIAPEIVPSSEAPVMDEVYVGEEANVFKLPAVRHHEMDIGPYFTMACCMKDPETGQYDVSFVKTYCRDPRVVGMSMTSAHHKYILEKYEKLGQAAPVIQILGHHPGFFLGSLAVAEFGNDDYATIGAIMQEPLRLTPSKTWGEDFLVPADAEIIIEGEIPPGTREILNPFGEVNRYYQAQSYRPVINVTAITKRRNAIMQDIFSGHVEHWNLGTIPREATLFKELTKRFPNVTAVHLPNSGCGRLSCYVSVKKDADGEIKLIALQPLLDVPKCLWVVVVDDDIDVFNEPDVLWAMLSCADPKRDITVIDNAYSKFITTSIEDSKVIIDATRPTDIAFPARIRVPEEALKRVRLEELLGS